MKCLFCTYLSFSIRCDGIKRLKSFTRNGLNVCYMLPDHIYSQVLQVELTCGNGESPEGQDVPSASDPAESEPA